MNKRRKPGLLKEIRDVLLPEDRDEPIDETRKRIDGSRMWLDGVKFTSVHVTGTSTTSGTAHTHTAIGNVSINTNSSSTFTPGGGTYTLNGTGTAEDPYNITIS